MQPTRFDFDVITGPVPPRSAAQAECRVETPSDTRTGSVAATGTTSAVANSVVSRHKAG